MKKNHEKAIQIGGGLAGNSLVDGDWRGGAVAGTGIRRGLGISIGRNGLADTLEAAATGHLNRDFAHVIPSIDRLAKADPKDVQQVAASQLQLMIACHRIDATQARRCFFWALVAAGMGFLLFLLAALASIASGSVVAAVVLVLSGCAMEAVAGLLFGLYSRSAAESRDFHGRLEAVQRHILANSICEGLSGDRKEQTRAELARKVANIHNASFLTNPLSAREPTSDTRETRPT
jgi:hypothetical protein